MRTPIFGPSYVSRSRNLADCRLINLYPEVVETKQGKEIGALYGTPGLDLTTTVGTGPIRGLHTMGVLLFVVSGGEFFSLDTSFNVTDIGPVYGTGAVLMIDNGTQIAIFSGATGQTWSATGGLNNIDLPFTTGTSPIVAAQQDGFGLITQPGTYEWFQSGLLDLTTWDALNVASASGDPDNIVTMAQLRREVWLIKQFETEIWYNAGTAGFIFARLDGVYLEVGCVAPGSLARSGETLIWLAQNKSGEAIVVQTSGHQANRISTAAIEDAFRGYSTVTDATAFTYQQDGHEFYMLNFPTADTTWCYDATQSGLLGVPCWHERLAFSNGIYHRHPADNHALFNDQHIVGDYQNGNLYAFNLDTFTDNGAARKWLRSWRAAPQPVEQPMRFNSLRLDMQTGIGVPAGTDPVVVLRYSDDGGHNWSTERYAEAGKVGQTARRVMFRRLGSTRRNSGLDRIFEVSSTDAFPAAIIGAELQ